MFGPVFSSLRLHGIMCVLASKERNGGRSLDPGNPLIVSTAPFVSISLKLVGTFGCNSQNHLCCSTDRERERAKNKKDQFPLSFIHQSLGSNSEIATHTRLPRRKKTPRPKILRKHVFSQSFQVFQRTY